ncbi:MAG: hypothetical protein WBM44_00325 [Waterburya sp.]
MIIISDISSSKDVNGYLKDVNEGLGDIVGGNGFIPSPPTRGFNKNIKVKFDASYNADVNLNLGNLSGNGAASDAYAVGTDTFTETYSEVAENQYSFSESGAFTK